MDPAEVINNLRMYPLLFLFCVPYDTSIQDGFLRVVVVVVGIDCTPRQNPIGEGTTEGVR